MKKLFILGLGLGLSVLTLNVHAQSNDIKFGIKAGANLMKGGKSEIAGSTYDAKYTPGFQAGVFVNIPLTEKFTFMPELQYAQKGVKFEETIAGNSGEIKSRVGYIDVPILFAYNATPDLFILLGPQASFFTNQSTSIYANGVKQGDTNTDSDNFRKSIAGGVVGLGYRVNPNVNINARYNMDFQTYTKESVNQDKARFSGFALSLGYAF